MCCEYCDSTWIIGAKCFVPIGNKRWRQNLVILSGIMLRHVQTTTFHT